MKIDLSKFVDIKENEYIITNAIYYRQNNELKLTIESNLDHFDDKVRGDLDKYLSYVNLTIEFIMLEPEADDEVCENTNPEVNEVEIIDDIDLDIEPRKAAANKDEQCEDDNPCNELIEKKEKDLQARISHAMNHSKEEKKEDVPVDGLDYGRKIKNDPIDIADIYDKKGMTVSLIGTVYGLDVFETRNHSYIYTFDLEDRTDALSCKIFVSQKMNDRVRLLRNGIAVQVEGVLNYDDYAHDDVFTINSLKDAVVSKRIDTAYEKRIELELHTKMTNLDGFVDNNDILSVLNDWEWDAIGITDTETLQGLPDLYDAISKTGKKMLPGAELLLVEDELRILTNLSDKEVPKIHDIKDCEFVVFDLETTGLSRFQDKITEIGAVRVKNGEITEEFNELVNPEQIIPEKIIELTGITNEMVMDKPKIDKVLPKFLEFAKDTILVGQNSDFDIGFVKENAKILGLDFAPIYMDTLPMARALFTDMGRFSLDKIARKLNIPSFNHHRASDDARATAQIFIKMYAMIMEQELNLASINTLDTEYPKSKYENFSATVFAKDETGLKNLYKLISKSRMENFNSEAKTPISLLKEYREGLLIGSGGHDGILFKSLLNDYSKDKIEDLLELFDFLQVEPLGIFADEVNNGRMRDYNQAIEIIKRIIELGKEYDKTVVATGGVRYLKADDYILRNILHKGQYFKYHENEPLYYLRTTNEMLDGFSYLDKDMAHDIVITNPKNIADQIKDIRPIPPGTFPPKIDGSEEKLRETCYNKARSIYGDVLPKIVEERLEKELNSIISNGYAVLYIIAKELVGKSNEDGYLVGSRGSVGSSFAATMADITEVNPLSPHYVCPECKHSEFFEEDRLGAGIDYPDKDCPECGTPMNKDGHNIPFEVFLGFEGDKEPDIDLNFAGEYQPTIHRYTEELFGEGKVFRAGTIGAIQDNTAFGYIKKYSEEYSEEFTNAQIRKLQRGLKDVKRTTGQHPGGLIVVPNDIDIFDITPIQYPADDPKGDIKTTHFTYNMMHETLLKLDLLGHDVPSIIRALQDLTNTDPLKIRMGDPKVMKIFSTTEPLDIKHDFSNNEIGTLGIPEFGTNFVRGMLKEAYPTKFSEMTRISGLSHGTDVWNNNARDLIADKTANFDEIISTRDDIMNSLIQQGLDKKESFQIMEIVRKGKALSEEQLEYMRENGVPEWYIESCLKIKYLFPKAHAVAYCLMSYRIAYYKVYYPAAFYATYFNTKLSDFVYSIIINGLESIQVALKSYAQRYDLTARDDSIRKVLEVAEEMYARDIKIDQADLYKSHASKFTLSEKEGYILPPLSSVDNVSEAMAIDIVNEREKGEFISIEDLNKRTAVNKNALESLKNFGIIDGLGEKNQMSLFDGMF
ncbi:PolC-type DNA polymerase III [uncultured Anaerococcus sp.]|uniref:PolC-type DNA polymerase III n=1 Tax=uncultured Anaerococcus sp. TaxID=293428 RepID=UPI00262B6FE2|nr:PolC-type DNA polymerase III [uncultured Anaerococcus sp.]